jgi:hypothetical protein
MLGKVLGIGNTLEEGWSELAVPTFEVGWNDWKKH